MPGDQNRILADLSDAFAAFEAKQARRVTDVEAEIDRMNLRFANTLVPGGGPAVGSAAAMAALGQFATSGTPQAAMSIGTTSDGGHIVAPELEKVIAARLAEINPLRALATVVTTHSSSYERVIATTMAAAEWVGETAARPATATPNLEKVVIPAHELYANAPATAALLDDAEADVATFLIDQLAQKFAAKEGAAFVSGTGTGQPRGFLDYTKSVSDDGARAFGSLQVVPSGEAATFGAEALLALLYGLRTPYRANSTWVMSSATALRVMRIKDAEGRFLWTDGLAAGQPAALLGRPVAICEDMPAAAANSTPIALADWRAGSLVSDRRLMVLIRDPYTAKPYINFYARKRVGGAVLDDNAIKLLRISTN